jgi:hypothetical protein
VGDADRVVPVRMKAEAVEVADHQQGRVLKGDGIVLELSESFSEVPAPALVLPAKVTPLPNVSPPLTAGGLGRATLEAETLALRVRLSRCGLSEKAAEVLSGHRSLLDSCPRTPVIGRVRVGAQESYRTRPLSKQAKNPSQLCASNAPCGCATDKSASRPSQPSIPSCPRPGSRHTFIRCCSSRAIHSHAKFSV